MSDPFFLHLTERKDIFKREKSPVYYVVLTSIICAIIVGLWISTREILEVATDFFEKMPEERVAKIVSDLPETLIKDEHREIKVDHLKPVSKKSVGGRTGGGGDPRSMVTKKGVLGVISGNLKEKSVASADYFGEGGFATGIDAVLSGVGGLKKGSSDGKGRKGLAYGEGDKSGFGGGGGGVDDLIGSLMGGDGGSLKLTKKAKISKQKEFQRGAQTAKKLTYSPSKFKTNDLEPIIENSFLKTSDKPISTFSIDVDKASYINIRRYITHNKIPTPNSVRLEEMINYFSYDYPYPRGKDPFSVSTEIADCPWNRENRLVHIGIKGRKLVKEIPFLNFVFLIDVSGSMASMNKLPLIKKSLKMLVQNLSKNDRIAIVTYAGKAGMVLNSTPCHQKEVIYEAIEGLTAEGSTAGSEGIKLAYRIASQNFLEDGNNRVILATDGDFNIGSSSEEELSRLIKRRRVQDLFLTVLGFGIDNEKDVIMERLAQDGDGNYSIIDDIQDAKKILVDESKGTFFIVGKDVKIQVEFNSTEVESYRLIGYENRLLKKEDFANDKVDAGDLGAEQNVTAIYEVVPTKNDFDLYKNSNEMFTLRLRYKEDGNPNSKLMEKKIIDQRKTLEMASNDFRFSAAVAGFGMLLQRSKYAGNYTYNDILHLAQSGMLGSSDDDRHEFLSLVKKTMKLDVGNLSEN